MHSSSQTIGAIATALAKAQAELENPEKTMLATIPSASGGRSFRYASLASGLDLVRKCLGEHEIAVMQTTAIDQAQIILTTLLVHASGEWVSSVWPVCPMAEPSAHVKGAALTYARRYALFALVGIAGEDDLDSPDLVTADPPESPKEQPPEAERAAGSTNRPPTKPTHHRATQPPVRLASERGTRTPTLPPEASEKLQHRLISELAEVSEPEALAAWAHRIMPIKNQLSVADAETIEIAFTARLNQLASTASARPAASHDAKAQKGRRVTEVVPIGKPMRERDRNHLRFVASQPCLICGRAPSDAHHVKFAEQRAMGRKVSDKFTVPICRLHHRELHRHGNERAWWESQTIDPLLVAAELWARTHKIDPAAAKHNILERTEINGRQSQINNTKPISKTKPIVRPEAG